MKIQKILLSVVAITAIGVTATAESRPYTSPPTTVLDVKTVDIPREAPLRQLCLSRRSLPAMPAYGIRMPGMLSIRKLNDHTVVECGFAKKQMPRFEREDFASELLQN